MATSHSTPMSDSFAHAAWIAEQEGGAKAILAMYALMATGNGRVVKHHRQLAAIEKVYGHAYFDVQQFGLPDPLTGDERILALCFMSAITEWR